MHSEKLQILTEILGEYYKSNEEYLFLCPFCEHHKRKLSINIHKNTYKCWICDTSGRNIYWLIKKSGTHSQKHMWRALENYTDISEFDGIFATQKQKAPTEQRVQLPKGYTCLINKKLPAEAKRALHYLQERNITKKDIFNWRIGYSSTGEYKNRIIIPSFDSSGYCNYFIARTYNKDFIKYKNPPVSKNIIFNELMLDWSKPIVLVEGVFDAIRAGKNSVPILGSTLGEKTKLFQLIAEHSPIIFIALDQDAEKKSLKIISNLLKYNVKSYKIDTSGHADIATMTKKEFQDRRANATSLDNETCLLYQIKSGL